jgi:hypothetical protein
MCEQWSDHDFTVEGGKTAITQDGAGYRCYALRLRCAVCGYETTDYHFRKLAAHEMEARPNRGRPRKTLAAYLREREPRC